MVGGCGWVRELRGICVYFHCCPHNVANFVAYFIVYLLVMLQNIIRVRVMKIGELGRALYVGEGGWAPIFKETSWVTVF